VRITPEKRIAEGDKVVLRWTFRGTHRGPLRGIPPAGRTVEWTGVDIYTVAAGQIADLVRAADTLALLQQLGATPPPAG
jgi:predicted ester cyclase